MSLQDRLSNDLKQAMREKNGTKRTVIRSLKSALHNEQIERGKPLTSQEEMDVLTREVKKRKDSLQEYEKANRSDLSESVQTELRILHVYMPEQLSEAALHQLVKETIDELGATSKADMGNVMSAIMPKVKGKADGASVNKMVQQLLSS